MREMSAPPDRLGAKAFASGQRRRMRPRFRRRFLFADAPRHDPQRPASLRLRARRERRDDPRQRARLRREGDRPAGGGNRSRQSLPARSLAENGRARAARHHRAGGVRRFGTRLSRALRRDGGGVARERFGRPFVRRPFEPLRQPDRAQRRRSAEGALSAEAHLGRARRRRWRCRSRTPAPTSSR